MKKHMKNLHVKCATCSCTCTNQGLSGMLPYGTTVHTGVTPTRKSNRDSCWQFDFQASTGVHWLRNHVKVMGEREILNKSYKFS